MELLIAVFAPLVAAPLMPTVRRWVGSHVGDIAALVPLAITVYFARFVGNAGDGEIASFHANWIPQLGLSLSFRLDGLGLLFVLLIGSIGTLVCVYAGGYLKESEHLGPFFGYMLAFITAMLGIVLSENLLTLYFFWELTTLTSFLLISFEHEQESARRAAMQALLTTAAGGLCLLAGVILLGLIGGSFEISELIANGDAVRSHRLYPAVLGLVLLGAFTKSAQFPFHYWLPNAMEAPTPVSAYLHSATMVKAGVFLLARLSPLLGGTELWTATVTGVGAVTMVVGAVLAFSVYDLKGVLAYLTVNVLGTLTMLIGIGSDAAIEAAIVYLVAHAFYKGTLFLIVGAIDHQAHTRDLRELSGLRQRMPLTAAVAGLAALSMAGVVPFLGFVAKESYLKAVVESPTAAWWLTAGSVLVSILVVAGAALVGVAPFFGRMSDKVQTAREAGLRLLLGPVVLAVAGLAGGLFPQRLITPLIEPAIADVLGESAHIDLALWHGVNLPLVFSVVALVLGVALYVARQPFRRTLAWTHHLADWGPARWYEGGLRGLHFVAHWQTSRLQSGFLRIYVFVLLATTALLAALMIARFGLPFIERPMLAVKWHEGIPAVLIIVASFVAVRSRSRMRAVVALTVVGFAASWIYALFGGPDLAMTQIVVETLTTLLLVFAFYRLPKYSILSSKRTRFRDALLASGVGIVMTLMVLLATGFDQFEHISEYFVQNSVSKAHGRNIVNVILVDFRALDTMGEITVLSAAAVGVYVIVRLMGPPPKGVRP